MKKRMSRVLSLLLAAVLLLAALPLSVGAVSVHNMTDVPSGQWYYKAVQYCLEKGYMVGMAQDRFAPTHLVSRAQMAQVLYNKGDGDSFDPAKNIFTDVDTTTWYAPPIIWCQQNGIINGTSPTTFSPDARVTREQVCVMVYNYYKGYLGQTPELADNAVMTKYTDWSYVSSWAKDAVRWAIQTKFMNGKSATTLVPKGQASRAELAQFLMNFDKILEGGGEPEPPAPEKPYTASTLARAELRYSYAERLMTLDGNENLIYYDNLSHSVYQVQINDGSNKREVLLDASKATCTVSVDGGDTTYKDLDVTQVFYDDVANQLILQGEFSEIDTSASGGWENPDAPSTYKGAFVLQDGQLNLFMTYTSSQFAPVFLDALANGKYVISNQTNYVNYGGKIQLWDSYTDDYTTLPRSDNNPKPYRYAAEVGGDIYAVSASDDTFFTHIHKYSFSSGNWEDVAAINCRYIGYADGLFYGWNREGNAVAIDRTGRTKNLYNVANDVLVTDSTPLPDSPKNLLYTSKGMLIFYDYDARAIRAVYPSVQ